MVAFPPKGVEDDEIAETPIRADRIGAQLAHCATGIAFRDVKGFLVVRQQDRARGGGIEALALEPPLMRGVALEAEHRGVAERREREDGEDVEDEDLREEIGLFFMTILEFMSAHFICHFFRKQETNAPRMGQWKGWLYIRYTPPLLMQTMPSAFLSFSRVRLALGRPSENLMDGTLVAERSVQDTSLK